MYGGVMDPPYSLANRACLICSGSNSTNSSSSPRILEVHPHGSTLSWKPEAGLDAATYVSNFVKGDEDETDAPDGLIVILADPCPREVKRLTDLLDLSPRFYSEYIAKNKYSSLEAISIDDLASVLPSQKPPEDSVHLHYQRPIYLAPHTSKLVKPFNLHVEGHTNRQVRLLPRLSEWPIGLARACVSIIHEKLRKDKWICLMLLDSTDAAVIPKHGDAGRFRAMQVSLRRLTKPLAAPGSMLWIINVEWLFYANVLGRLLKYYEPSRHMYADSATYNMLIEHTTDLYSWRRRNLNTSEKLQSLLTFIETQSSSDTHPATDILINDIITIRKSIQDYSAALESLLPSLMSAIQLLQAQKAIEQTEYVKRLSWLALVFLPLSLVASLFSMDGGFAINTSSGVARYAAVAVPLLIIVLLVSSPAFQFDRLFRRVARTFRKWS